jgi:hypothetical protein
VEKNNIFILSDILEYRISSRGNNRSVAAKIFREKNCITNDFRTPKILSNTFNFLIGKFKQNEGVLKLTNTSKCIGDITLDILNAKQENPGDAKSIMMGDFIIDLLITEKYLILHREEYFSVDEVILNRKKKKINFNPYTLEVGESFPKIEMNPSERTGISLRKYAPWKDGKRVVENVTERLIKSNVKIDKSIETTQFMKSITFLENVKWTINPDVAAISSLLKDKLINTLIELHDFDNNIIMFDTIDIRRTNINKKYKGIDLYKSGDIFEPHLGNSSAVPLIEKSIEKQTKRLNRLINVKNKEETKKILHKLHVLYNTENRRWTDKQFCLRTQSQAMRNKAILETINGNETNPGWLGYNFYQSMYLDYRGRIYNRDPYFSYQSNDLVRGHFLFAEKKEMTQEGAEYTFIHAACSYNQTYTIKEIKENTWLELDYITELENDGLTDISVDKMGINDKHNWTIENINMLLDIAEEPIKHIDIWMNAEKPWVFLSLCFEVGAIIGSSLTGEPHYSNLPISIDGVNNGTQHLAAMSRDKKAGLLVGLIPLEIPKDFYLKIGKEILNINETSEIKNKLNKIPMKLIRKGISKRGSMTRAYDAGANKIGQIIYQDSYDAGITSTYKINKSDCKQLGKDLVEAYDKVCTGPVMIKKYLQSIVKYKLQDMNMKDVTWFSPSGFPVLTQKWVARKKVYYGNLQGKTIGHVYLEITDIPSLSDHLSAIGANWVHSYDAAHMCLTVNKIKEKDMEFFGAIHDSFSMHASDIPELIQTTKETFISLYDKDIFSEMRQEIIYNNKLFNEKEPELGDMDLNQILKSNFFFC